MAAGQEKKNDLQAVFIKLSRDACQRRATEDGRRQLGLR